MMHQLPPVDDEVFAALQARAVPLVDDVNSVLRRLLGLDAQTTHETQAPVRRSSVKEAAPLPDSEYELPLLRCLAALGGKAPSAEVIDAVGDDLGDRLQSVDKAVLKSGDIRWRNKVQFARLRLVRSGHLSKTSPRGTWELTAYGADTAKKSEGAINQ